MFTFALVCEFTDLFCEDVSFECTNCGDGLSSKYKNFKPTTKTTKSNAIKNIESTISTSQSFVHWRKYFITTAIILFLMFVYKQSTFNCSDFVVFFLMIFVTLQLVGNFYKYHYENHKDQIIKDNLQILNN
jgi:hypothetical protein